MALDIKATLFPCTKMKQKFPGHGCCHLELVVFLFTVETRMQTHSNYTDPKNEHLNRHQCDKNYMK